MQQLHRYMVGIAKNNDFALLLVGGVADHVHLVVALPTSLAVAKAVQLLKGGSSKWFNEEYRGSGFAWQQGFGAFTVSQSQFNAVADYIRNQDYDPKYVLG